MPAFPGSQLHVPNQTPKTDSEHAENMRAIEDWANRFPIDTISFVRLQASQASVMQVISPNVQYNAIELITSAKSSQGGAITNIRVVFNSDTGANYYSDCFFTNNGSAPATFSEVALTSGRLGTVSDNRNGSSRMIVPSYTDFQNKTCLYENAAYGTNRQYETGFMLWTGAAPITTVTFTNPGGSFLTGSTFLVRGLF